MSSMLRWAGGSAEAGPQVQVSRLFPATVGRFDDRADRAVIDGLTRWVEDRYREDLAKRPSKHVYVRTLPGPVIEQIDRLRDSPLIRSLIARPGPGGQRRDADEAHRRALRVATTTRTVAATRACSTGITTATCASCRPAWSCAP